MAISILYMGQYNRDLNDMAIFAEIVTAQGLSAAADKLGLPKSNVSRRLARLEKRLGVQLIERTTRSNRLTPIGVCYADYCRLMVEEAIAADNVIDRSQSEPSGDLRISASVLIGQQVIAPVLADYMNQYPKVTISMELTNHRVNLIENGIDLAFRIGGNEDSTLIAKSVGHCAMRPYASPAYLSSHGKPKSPNNLSKHRCLLMKDTDNAHHWTLYNGKEERHTHLNVIAIVNDFISLRTMALSGAGIALLPDYAVCDEVEEGLLQPVFKKWCVPSTELTAVFPSRRGATAKVRTLIECVQNHFESSQIKMKPLTGSSSTR